MISREEAAKRIAIRIKSALKRRKMTITRLGENLGVGRATVSAWVQAKNIPPAWRLYEVARILSVPMEYFLEEDEDKAKDMLEEDCSESQLLDLYRSMNRKQRKALVNFLRTALEAL